MFTNGPTLTFLLAVEERQVGLSEGDGLRGAFDGVAAGQAVVGAGGGRHRESPV